MKYKNKVPINFDEHKYGEKPVNVDKWEPARIKKRLHPVAMTIAELADNCIHGTTFTPGVLKADPDDETKNGMNDASWIGQQLFVLDFDHVITIPKCIERCKELDLKPCFMYTSFSHSEKEHKFRVIFCNDGVISDGEKRDKIQAILFILFKYADEKCLKRHMYFFGGKQLITDYYDYDAEFKGEELLQKYGYLLEENPDILKKATPSTGNTATKPKKVKTPKEKDNNPRSPKANTYDIVTHKNKVTAIINFDISTLKVLLGNNDDYTMQRDMSITNEEKLFVKTELYHRGLNDLDIIEDNIEAGTKDIIDMLNADSVFTMKNGYPELPEEYEKIIQFIDCAYRYYLSPDKDKNDEKIKTILILSYIYIIDKVYEN